MLTRFYYWCTFNIPYMWEYDVWRTRRLLKRLNKQYQRNYRKKNDNNPKEL